MRWRLAVVLLAVFLSGLIFSRISRIPQQRSPSPVAVASVDDLMKALTVPASDVVFKAGARVNSSSGLKGLGPRNADDWQTIERSAAVLAESGNLLLIGSRLKDQRQWVTFTRAFIEASKSAKESAREKKLDALEASLDEINLTCERCHVKYLVR